MRIIAGTLGGRQFDSPKSHTTHPMSDKMRGAIFNILGDLEGLAILDAFAGSGALGFEAISRGAAHVTLIENDQLAQKVIEGNIQGLDLEVKSKLVKAAVGAWLTTSEATFDIILCDPPYDDLHINALKQLANRLKLEGLIVYSLPPNASVLLTSNFQLLTTKSYGDSQLQIFRRVI